MFGQAEQGEAIRMAGLPHWCVSLGSRSDHACQGQPWERDVGGRGEQQSGLGYGTGTNEQRAMIQRRAKQQWKLDKARVGRDGRTSELGE